MTLWVLLIVFKFKHFVADYLLQGRYMLGKFKKEGWQLPLMAHCGVHKLFTFFIALAAGAPVWTAYLAAALDFWIHFTMDRVKASPNLMGRWKALTAEEYAKVEAEVRAVPGLGGDLEEHRRLDRVSRPLRHNTYFWWAIGFDQMIHGLTDLLSCFLIITLR